MSWLTTTLDAPTASRKQLPEGLNNFEVTGARAETNEYNGRNELVVNFTGPAGGGVADFPLEPWASDQKSVDQFIKMFTSNAAGIFGIETQGRRAQEVMGDIVKALDNNSAIGNIVEINVVYAPRKDKGDGKHLREDGTPWMNAKPYVNRLVQKAAPKASIDDAFEAAAVPAGFGGDDDIPFG